MGGGSKLEGKPVVRLVQYHHVSLSIPSLPPPNTTTRLGGWQQMSAVVEEMKQRLEDDAELAPFFGRGIQPQNNVRQYTVSSIMKHTYFRSRQPPSCS